jgi:FAD/FMN-containing dehydrogenase
VVYRRRSPDLKTAGYNWYVDAVGGLILLANRGTEISKTELDDLGLFASILGHIGDGNFHASIMYDPKNPEEKARVEKVVYDMVDRALDMEGSCTVGYQLPLVQWIH